MFDGICIWNTQQPCNLAQQQYFACSVIKENWTTAEKVLDFCNTCKGSILLKTFVK